ncbi:peptide ABC transporter substrate-binding protein [Glycocaulis profundi]|nr:peptide ABC transporter substrate-binding protein [Glycocaulis profundi]
MTNAVRLAGIFACGASALALTACGAPRDDDAVVLHRGNLAEPLSLDPHRANGVWENNIIGDMFIGLFTEAADGETVPGMAESWETSEDGLTWTFTLREAYWSDGEPVTAHDFEFAFRRIMNPETLAQYASVLYPIRNAIEVNRGEMEPEELGVRAEDDRTLVVELAHPAPFLPTLFAHYTSFPVPRHVVEVYGDAWIQPGNMVTNGAYTLVQWRTNNFVHVERNERFWDNANVCVDEVFYYPTVDANAAERRVRNGELHLNPEFNGQNLDFLRREVPDYVQVGPYLGLTYYPLNTTQPPFDDVRVRQALGMALNREFITSQILRAGEEPAFTFVPPGVTDYPGTARLEWADESIETRRERARELLEEAGYGPSNPLRIDYVHRATAEHPRVAPVIQQDWQEIAPWVQVSVSQRDTQIHYDNLRAGDFTAADGGWIADYNDAYNFLFLGETQSIPMNYARWSNEEFDRLVAEANLEADAGERGRLLSEAEQLLLDEMPYIPGYYLVNRSLVNPNVTGWEHNQLKINRTRYLCLADVERPAPEDGGTADAPEPEDA